MQTAYSRDKIEVLLINVIMVYTNLLNIWYTNFRIVINRYFYYSNLYIVIVIHLIASFQLNWVDTSQMTGGLLLEKVNQYLFISKYSMTVTVLEKLIPLYFVYF